MLRGRRREARGALIRKKLPVGHLSVVPVGHSRRAQNNRYIFVIHRSSWVVNRNTNTRYWFWLFHCGRSARLGKHHYVAASYQIASNQSKAVTKCLLMRLFFSYLCLLSNRKLHIYFCLIDLKRHNDASQNKPDIRVVRYNPPGNSCAVRVSTVFLN